MYKYCEWINISIKSAIFIFEGEWIEETSTPYSLNMWDNDEITVIIE